MQSWESCRNTDKYFQTETHLSGIRRQLLSNNQSQDTDGKQDRQQQELPSRKWGWLFSDQDKQDQVALNIMSKTAAHTMEQLTQWDSQPALGLN